MDIAITPAGLMLIEINTGGSFTLPQFASGRGFLTDEVRAFFAGVWLCQELTMARPPSRLPTGRRP